MMFRYLLPALLLAAPAALAQTTAPAYDLSATHRYVQPTQLWPQVQGIWSPHNRDYVLLAVQGRRILNDAYAAGRNLGFDARQLAAGYEHFAGSEQNVFRNWSFGGTVRLVGMGGPVAVIPEVLLRHRSLIVGQSVLGGLVVGQRLSLERTLSSGATQALESGPADETWGRLRFDVEQVFTLSTSGVALRPRLSYEAATHLRLQKATTDPDERAIQFASLRAEVGVRLPPGLDLTPWFAYQTRYLETLPQYDASGNPTAGGKINAVYPTFGLDLRFTLGRPQGTDEAFRGLPTQY